MKKHPLLVLVVLLAGCRTQPDTSVRETTVTSDVIPPEMVPVPGTKYEIAVDPVTNRQYEEFLKATGRRFPVITDYPRGKGKDENYPWDGLLWSDNRPPEGKDICPVALVTKVEAEAYCEWISKELGRQFILPSRDVYEKAMKGASYVRIGNEALAKSGRSAGLEATGIMWYPLTILREYPDFRSDIGCYVQSQSFYEWLAEGAGQPAAWHSTNKEGEAEQRYLFVMQGPGRRLCVLGFRLASKTDQ